MSGAVAGSVALVALAVSALALAGMLRSASRVELLLAAYVIGVAVLVLSALLLTPFNAMRRVPLLAGLAILGALSFGLWWRSRPDRRVSSARTAARVTFPTAVWVLAASVALAGAYLLWLVVTTPPNTEDSLTYHLTRAAFWRQDGEIGYIAHAYDERMNANPPHAEIVLAVVLEIARWERAAGLVQLLAWLASGAAVFALGRRLRLDTAECALGSMLFVLLPVVLLQGSTTQNDLFLASLLLAATVFLVGESRGMHAVAAVATCLAVGTKVTAVFALPVLVAVALLAEPSSLRRRRMLTLTAGGVAGTWWYVVNVIETGSPLGERPDRGVLTALEPLDNALAALARGLDAMDVPGVGGDGVLVYLGGVALVTLAGILLSLDPRARLRPKTALAAGILMLIPLSLVPLGYIAWRVFAKLHDLVPAEDRRLPVSGWTEQTAASDIYSWFGPVGLVLVVATAVVAIPRVRRRELPTLAGVLAFAPLAWFILLSATLAYDPWQGRFFMYPIGLAAVLWGTLLTRRTAVVMAVTSVAILLAGLSLAQYREKPPSASSRDRWDTQSLHRRGMAEPLRFLEERVPDGATLALALGVDDWGYPMFGPRLSRRVLLVPPGVPSESFDARWLVVGQARLGEVSRRCWGQRAEGAVSVFERRSACR